MVPILVPVVWIELRNSPVRQNEVKKRVKTFFIPFLNSAPSYLGKRSIVAQGRVAFSCIYKEVAR